MGIMRAEFPGLAQTYEPDTLPGTQPPSPGPRGSAEPSPEDTA